MSKGYRVDGFFIPKSFDKNNDSALQVSELNIWCKENDLKYDIKTKKIIPVSWDESSINVDTKLDSNKYSLESLKRRYPSDKYQIINSVDIQVIDKKTGHIVLKFFSNANGIYIDMFDKNGESVYFRNYDKNGNLLFYDKDKQRRYPIVENINAAVSAKTKFKLPTTDVNKLVLNVKRLTSDNIGDLYYAYYNEYGESICQAINNEFGLDDNIKKDLINHINKCLYALSQRTGFKPNCKIDQAFYQGNVGDCWFLATVAAVRRSPKGQEILNNMIKDNKDGTYTIKFKGTDESITVSISELYDHLNWANGDLDVRLLEIAADKYYNILGIDGGNPASAMELLLGTGDFWKNVGRHYSSKPGKQKIANLLNNPNIVMTAAINPCSKLWGIIVKDVPDNATYKDDIATAHGYAVSKIDDKNIYLINPWYTDKEIAIPLDVFEEYWGCIQYTEIT